MKISFIGEVMLGREVGAKFSKQPYTIVEEELKSCLNQSDYTFANLEAPINDTKISEDHLMMFNGKSETLKEVDFINGFSLANNHINDTGSGGIYETIINLEKQGFQHNGIYTKYYEPLKIENGYNKIAIICCTDVLNTHLEENFEYNLLWLNNKEVIFNAIKKCKEDGFFVILYVHGGIMFSRYPNPLFRNDIRSLIDEGADSVITIHPHVLGGHEVYKDKYIFYSLGDFIMDGHSERRREATVLNIEINNNILKNFEIKPTFINKKLETVIPNKKRYAKILKSWNEVSKSLKRYSNEKEYEVFYKKQFKKELSQHMRSTIMFQLKYKSPFDFFELIFSRFKDFKNMSRWFFKDTSKMRNNLEDESML